MTCGTGVDKSWAQAPVEVGAMTEPLPLQGNLAYFKEADAPLSIEQLLQRNPSFTAVKSPVANFGYTADRQNVKPIWLRFNLNNQSSKARPLYTQVNFWCFDSLQFFLVVRDSVRVATASIGWQTPVEQRFVYSRHFLFPFTLNPNEEATAYIRVLKSRGTQIMPLTVLPQSAFNRVTQTEYLFWGGTLFALAFVTLMTFFFYLTTRVSIYYKYTLTLVGLTGFFVINEGFLNQFAFSAQSWLPGQNIYFLFPLLIFYTQLIFIRSFLTLRKTPAYRWHYIAKGVLISGIFCLFTLVIERFVILPIGLESVLMRIFTLCYWLPMPVIGAYIFISLYRGYHVNETVFYLIAVTPFYVLNFGQILANFGILDTTPAVAYYAYLGLAALWEVLVLTLGLAYRYRFLRDHKEKLVHQQGEQQRLVYEAEVRALAVHNTLLLEKARIGRDLHDNVGAHLSFVVTNLGAIIRQAERQPLVSTGEWTTQLRQLVGTTREAIGMLRETIWAVHQDELTLADFGNRLQQYIDRSIPDTDGLLVHLKVHGELQKPLTSGQVLNLFRIVQEALNNIVKHADASRVRIALTAQPENRIHLQISDNGRGLTEQTIDTLDQHYGLRNMQRRAEELGGQFRIYSAQGTTVEIDL
ncbi:MAG: histidine kinase [Cytophagales bacterium]|nr:MAG: histidine kinase [Cytophagales bacterium]